MQVSVCALALQASAVYSADIKPSSPSIRNRSFNSTGPIVELSLEDAVALGLRNNRSVRSAYLSRVTQKFDLRVAEDKFTPKLELSSAYLFQSDNNGKWRDFESQATAFATTPTGATVSVSWTDSQTDADPLQQHTTLVSLNVVQPLLRDAGISVNTASVRLARLEEQSYRLDLQSSVTDALTQIILAYREVLRSQDEYQIAQSSLERSRALLDVNHDLISAGRMASVDAIQTEADVATQELAVEEAVNSSEAARIALLKLLSLDLGTQITVAAVQRPTQVILDLEKVRNLAGQYEPSLLRQVITTQQADIELEVARNNRLWDVSLVAGAERERTTLRGVSAPSSDHSTDKYVGIQVSIPLGDLSRKQEEVRAQVNLEKQTVQLEETRAAMEQQVRDAVREVNTRWRQFEIAQRARSLSVQKVDIEKEKLQVGRSSNFQVLAFESDLRSAESALVSAEIGYLNSLTLLDQKIGVTLATWEVELND